MNRIFIYYSILLLNLYLSLFYKECNAYYSTAYHHHHHHHRHHSRIYGNHINDLPRNPNQDFQATQLFHRMKLFSLISLTTNLAMNGMQLPTNKIANAGFVGEYIDKNNKFSLIIPPGNT